MKTNAARMTTLLCKTSYGRSRPCVQEPIWKEVCRDCCDAILVTGLSWEWLSVLGFDEKQSLSIAALLKDQTPWELECLLCWRFSQNLSATLRFWCHLVVEIKTPVNYLITFDLQSLTVKAAMLATSEWSTKPAVVVSVLHYRDLDRACR